MAKDNSDTNLSTHFIKPIHANVHLVTLFKLIVVGLLLSFSRLCFYIFNSEYFSELNTIELTRCFLGGLRFDISTIFLLNIPFITVSLLFVGFFKSPYFQRINCIVFNIFNIFGVFLNYIDTAYYPYSHKRLNADFFKTKGMLSDVTALSLSYIKDYWHLTLILAINLFIIIYINKKVQVRPFRKNVSNYIKHVIFCLIWVFLAILGIRGGLQSRPIKITTAAFYTKNNHYIPLVTNTPFSIMTTLKSMHLAPMNYFESHEIALNYFNPIQYPKNKGAFKPLNVVIIILESFSAEYVGALNQNLSAPYTGYTPFLDSIIPQSMIFNSYANGSTSIQSVPAIIASIPSLMQDPYSNSIYSSNTINTLPNLLKKKGYISAFFHGGRNGTMAFDSFASIAGFDAYYGKNEYNNNADYDGKWGIYDGPFLQYFLKTIDTFKEPFFATVFTLSSHHPYNIPPSSKGHFPLGTLPIHESIGYVDQCLKEFFENAQKKDWYKNTLFVITADHSSKAYYPQYQLKISNQRIPIIYYHPHSNLIGNNHEYSQQTDILPTVLDYLNYKEPFIAFGESVLNQKNNHFSIIYNNGSYLLRKNKHWLVFDGTKTNELYNITDDYFLKNNLAGKNLNIETELEYFIKSLIQQYNERIINNDLIIH